LSIPTCVAVKKEVEDVNHYLVPFPLKDKPKLCPILHCYAAKVFYDLEKLQSHINFDLSQIGELQETIFAATTIPLDSLLRPGTI
jgi:hypothetical protein